MISFLLNIQNVKCQFGRKHKSESQAWKKILDTTILTSYRGPSNHEEKEGWWRGSEEPYSLLDARTLKDLYQLLPIFSSVDSPAKS